jgi:hypothetical protein
MFCYDYGLLLIGTDMDAKANLWIPLNIQILCTGTIQGICKIDYCKINHALMV